MLSKDASRNFKNGKVPWTHISGCFYHLSLNLWKQIQRARYRKYIWQNHNFLYTSTQAHGRCSCHRVPHKTLLMALIKSVCSVGISMAGTLMMYFLCLYISSTYLHLSSISCPVSLLIYNSPTSCPGSLPSSPTLIL